MQGSSLKNGRIVYGVRFEGQTLTIPAVIDVPSWKKFFPNYSVHLLLFHVMTISVALLCNINW
jgi:hypothetical protein